MTSSRPMLMRFVAALGVVVLALGGYALLSQRTSGDKSAATKGVPPEKEEFSTFRDEEAGFAVGYPQSWRAVRSETDDPQVRLVVGPIGARDYLRIRVLPLGTVVTINAKTPKEDINALQAQLDKYVDEAPGVTEVHERNRVNVNDLPGWFYLYTFKDPQTGEEGLHSHIFLFDQDQMDVLVFQALPSADYESLSPVFDRMLESFRSLRQTQGPSPAPASPTPAP